MALEMIDAEKADLKLYRWQVIEAFCVKLALCHMTEWNLYQSRVTYRPALGPATIHGWVEWIFAGQPGDDDKPTRDVVKGRP